MPGPSVDPPFAVLLVASLDSLPLPLGGLLLLALLATGNVGRPRARSLLVSLALVVSGLLAAPFLTPFLLRATGSHDAGMVVTPLLGLAAAVALAWPHGRPRLLAGVGAALFVARQLSLVHASALYVRASGDPAFWGAALAWPVATYALGAVASVAMAAAFAVLAVRAPPQANLEATAPLGA
jgi:hypothetical protein